MKKSLFFAALVALSLTVFGPVDSFAKGGHGNGYNNGNNHNGNGHNGHTPPNGNNHKVPEPATMALLGAAAMGAIYLKNRASKQ